MQQLAASNTILQTIADESKLGRVMSYYSMAFVGAAPFGSLAAGAAASHIGTPLTLAIGGVLVGICGGYQMLGKKIHDPEHVESSKESIEGLGLLPIETSFLSEKATYQVHARVTRRNAWLAGLAKPDLQGYEIHMGETILGPKADSFARITDRSGQETEILDGAVSRDGRVFGTYLHGVFDNDRFRTAFLNRLRTTKGLAERSVPTLATDPLDLLADHLERHLDLAKVWAICGLTPA